MNIVKEDIVVVKHSDYLDREQYKILKKLLQTPIIRESLDKGAWIAGGFGRNIILKKDITEYILGQEEKDEFGFITRHPAGDIDIYFPNRESATEMVDLALKMEDSYRVKKTDYSETYTVSLNGFTYPLIIQLINKKELIFTGGFIECFNSFDFYNVMVAIDDENIYYHKLIPELEREKKLKINSNISPILGHRIYKYMLSRGMTGITEDSEEKLKEWLFMASFTNFKQFFAKMKIANSHYEKTLIDHYLLKVKKIFHILKEKDKKSLLAIFVGKYQDSYEEKYGVHVTVDWATNQICKMKNQEA